MLSGRHNIDKELRFLSDLALRQLPFASAMALNDTAEDVAEAEVENIEKSFDRPTPFTKKALYRVRASKRKLRAEVGVKRVQAGYLDIHARGGTRKPKARAILVPNKARLNKYGNMPRGAVKRMMARPGAFVASRSDPKTRHLDPGIYIRKGRGRRQKIEQLVAFRGRAQYRPRFDFQGPADLRANQVIANHLSRRLQDALRTAK